jgi:hypothetical protein
MNNNLKVLKAIHNVQQALEVIGRTEKADVGKYSYKYASMSTIWNELKPLLKREGLTIIQAPSSTDGQAHGDFLTTGIYHESGEFMTTTSRLVITRDDPQGYGSAITYARRYALVSMLGIITDDDNDASTQRLADGEMKKEWVTAFTVIQKKVAPDTAVTNAMFINFMTEVYGKHPSKVLAKEHQHVLDTIKAFDTK